MKTQTIDPVCGMTVKEPAAHRAQHGDTEYLFCSSGCRHEFQAEPERFLKQGGQPSETKPIPVWGGDSENVHEEGRGKNWTDYIPLMVIVVLTLAAASAKQLAHGEWHGVSWMHDFMGLFLIVFSMFKFFNMGGFADGFQMYDLLAKPVRKYAYVYPFIELGLGLGYLAHWQPTVIYTATVVVMVFGSLGVFNALRKRLNINCACMGTVLKVPLSTVALVENLGMAVMAGVMLMGTK